MNTQPQPAPAAVPATPPLSPAERRATDLYLRALARRARNSEGFGG